MTNELGIFISNDRPVVSSRDIARVFEKRHDAVLRDIRNLGCSAEFNAHNFVDNSYKDSMNRDKPEYLITRDGFSFLAMGFTGAKAAEFKEKYIAAFNAMERELINRRSFSAFGIPRTLPEALRLAANLEEERQTAIAQREALNSLHDRAARLKDTVMLGDEKVVLAMLDTFSKEEF